MGVWKFSAFVLSSCQWSRRKPAALAHPTVIVLSVAVLCGAEIGVGRGWGVLAREESVAGPHAPRRGGTRAGGRARPLARDQPRRRSPGDRPPGGEEMCGPLVSAGSGTAVLRGGERGASPAGPSLDRRGERKRGLSFCQLGKGPRGSCQSLGDLWGGGGLLGGDG